MNSVIGHPSHNREEKELNKMENRTNYRRTTRAADIMSKPVNTAKDSKTEESVPFRCSGDITVHSKTGDSGRTSYRMNLCKEDKNTGDPVFFTLWVSFAKDAKTLCGALPSNGKARIRVNDAFLSVSLADGNPVLVVMSAEILKQ